MAHRDLHETIELLAGDQGALADILARAVARLPDKRPGRPAELIGLVRRLFVDSSRATIDRAEVPPELTPQGLTPPHLPGIDEEGGLDDKTIEESSPLFKDPSAAPRSPLFGPNAPTLLGRRAAGSRPPTAIEPPAAAPAPLPRAEPPVVVEPMVEVPAAPAPVNLQVQSHKPMTPVPPPATPILSAIDRPEMQPVLRPISAVAKPSYPPGSLGHYAPPVAPATAPAMVRRRWPWVLLGAMLVAAGAGLTIGLAVTSRHGSGDDDTVEAVAADEPGGDPKGATAAPPPPPPPPEPVVRPVEPCAAEMLLVQGELLRAARRPFCVDRHEAPGSGKPPQVGLTRDSAEAACKQRGARLCSPQEWEDACLGADRGQLPLRLELRGAQVQHPRPRGGAVRLVPRVHERVGSDRHERQRGRVGFDRGGARGLGDRRNPRPLLAEAGSHAELAPG